MKVFVPHYTCKSSYESGPVCLKIVTDYLNNVRINEKKLQDLTEIAQKTAKKISMNNPLKMPLIYDLAKLAIKNFRVGIFREKDAYNDDFNGLFEYEAKIKDELIEKGAKIIIGDFEELFFKKIKKHALIVFADLNKLYSQTNLGFGWIVALEYNELKKEVIIYDPMYYARVPKSKNYERLSNTLKRRYISFKQGFFMKSLKGVNEALVRDRDKKNKPSKPFVSEFFAIAKPNM